MTVLAQLLIAAALVATAVLVTVFGEVTVTRMAYRAPGAANLHPADAELNLPEEKHSHGMRKLAAIESARGSFESAAQAITRATGAVAGKRQVEQLARRAAADVDAFYAARRPGPRPDDELLVVTFDGKGIVMRPEALRPATAKAAENGHRKLATRLSPGEKHSRKRMAELAAVYDAAPASRSPADIIRLPGQEMPARRPGPAAKGKWLTASVTDDITAVIAAGFDEAGRRDPGHQRTWVALVGGNATQIEAITVEAKRRHVTVHIVCDFIHVLEFLWKAAWSFFEPGDPDAEDWVAAQAVKILEGKAAQAAAGIRRRATTYGYTGTECDGADTCAAYLTAKKPYLGYATALAQGWPIATGVIEGACRHLVKDRMDITGAHGDWTVPKPSSNSAPSPPAAASMTTGASTCNKNTSASTALATVSLHDQLTSKEPHPYAYVPLRVCFGRPAAQSAADPRKFPDLRSSRAAAPRPHHPEDNGHDDENDPDQEQEIADLVDVESRTMHGDTEPQDGSDDHKNDPQQHQADA